MLVLWALVQSLGHQLGFLGTLMRVNVVRLHLRKVELLRPEDGAWTSNADPADERLSRDLEVLHCPEANQSPRATEASLAVDSDGAAVGLLKVRLDNVEELFDNAVGRRRSINKKQIVVSDTFVQERLAVVLLLVEADHPTHTNILENIAVLIGMVAVAVVSVALLNGSHKGDELPRDDHVHVSVFNTLVVLVLFDVESLKVVPAKLHSGLQTLQAVEHSAVEEAVALGGVTVVLKDGHVGLELLMCLLGRHLKDDYAKGAHEESSVDHLVSRVRRAAVVEDAVLRVVLVAEEAGQLAAVPVHHGEVQRAEVLVEGEVSEVVVDVEKEGVLKVLRRLLITDPVEFVCKILVVWYLP